MTRGIRPHRAFDEAIPIARARGLIQKAMSGPEQIFDIAIVSKVPYTFARIMFAPEILATVQDLAEYYGKEIARLRLIARDAAATAELWLRSKHGTWPFFQIMPSSLVEIDREGKRIESGHPGISKGIRTRRGVSTPSTYGKGLFGKNQGEKVAGELPQADP